MKNLHNGKIDSLHRHLVRNPDPDFCSCCQKSIIHGLQNVVKIPPRMENVMTVEGLHLGQRPVPFSEAYYHARCFQDHHSQGVQIECDLCGMFSLSGMDKDAPIKAPCQCLCHNSPKDGCISAGLFKEAELYKKERDNEAKRNPENQ